MQSGEESAYIFPLCTMHLKKQQLEIILHNDTLHCKLLCDTIPTRVHGGKGYRLHRKQVGQTLQQQVAHNLVVVIPFGHRLCLLGRDVLWILRYLLSVWTVEEPPALSNLHGFLEPNFEDHPIRAIRLKAQDVCRKLLDDLSSGRFHCGRDSSRTRSSTRTGSNRADDMMRRVNQE